MTQRLPLKTVFKTGALLSCSILCSVLALAQDPQPASGAATAAESQDSGSILSPTAPQSYTVRRGDTLWSIATTFLRDPWLWPEIWYVNPQVENPHLIYPGDILNLVYGKDGKPQIVLQRGDASRLSPQVRSQPLEGAIQTLPYEMIAAFMSRPTVLDKSQIKAAPHVFAYRDSHLIGAPGNTLYARGGKQAISDGEYYNIVHVGEKLKDPDGKDSGYQCHYTASAKVTRGGDPATLMITESARETFEGDLLLPSEPQIANDFLPRAPEKQIKGRIISLVDSLSLSGQYQVVVINRGEKDGLQPGHVLGIFDAGDKVRDKHAGLSSVSEALAPRVRLPDERTGTFMVFKTYERISYGLVMSSEAPIRNHDRVGNP